MYAFVHLPLCLFALCVCVYVGCVSSCVLFFSCFILYSPRLSYLSMLSQSVMSCLSCLRLSLPCAHSCSFAPSRLPFVHSCVMFLSFLFYWESLVIPCTVCFPCGIMLICVTCVPWVFSLPSLSFFFIASKSLNLGPILPALHTVHDITVMVLGRWPSIFLSLVRLCPKS